jgi:hypothetical protein
MPLPLVSVPLRRPPRRPLAREPRGSEEAVEDGEPVADAGTLMGMAGAPVEVEPPRPRSLMRLPSTPPEEPVSEEPEVVLVARGVESLVAVFEPPPRRVSTSPPTEFKASPTPFRRPVSVVVEEAAAVASVAAVFLEEAGATALPTSLTAFPTPPTTPPTVSPRPDRRPVSVVVEEAAVAVAVASVAAASAAVFLEEVGAATLPALFTAFPTPPTTLPRASPRPDRRPPSVDPVVAAEAVLGASELILGGVSVNLAVEALLSDVVDVITASVG